MIEGDFMIDHILKASEERDLIITIIYSGSSGITERNIKVLDIHENRVKAYCYLRKQIRYFNRESILSAAYWYGKFRAIS
jgi:predicted DNA-binding transcriptional regulator YafY